MYVYQIQNQGCDDTATYDCDGVLLSLNLNSEINYKSQSKMEPKLFKQLCEVVYSVILVSCNMRMQLKVLTNVLPVSHKKIKYLNRDAFTACTDTNMWIMLIGFDNTESRAEIVDKIIAVLKQIPKYRQLQQILLMGDDIDQHRIYDWCRFGTYSKLTRQILIANNGKVILSCNMYPQTEAAF